MLFSLTVVDFGKVTTTQNGGVLYIANYKTLPPLMIQTVIFTHHLTLLSTILMTFFLGDIMVLLGTLYW